MIRKTMDYFSMVDLFVRSGLEISPEDPAPEGMITCFELLDESGLRQAAGGLCKVNGEYVLRHVAVEEAQRGRGYGKQMVAAVM
ncbi:MAG: N-acetyltransferase, partial [Lachnospiraceae bacterium]|nr:N-acetyltransferase [Lachnospiraceae bacterium]